MLTSGQFMASLLLAHLHTLSVSQSLGVEELREADQHDLVHHHLGMESQHARRGAVVKREACGVWRVAYALLLEAREAKVGTFTFQFSSGSRFDDGFRRKIACRAARARP
jgi:hypothetical protein